MAHVGPVYVLCLWACLGEGEGACMGMRVLARGYGWVRMCARAVCVRHCAPGPSLQRHQRVLKMALPLCICSVWPCAAGPSLQRHQRVLKIALPFCICSV